jgi:putative ABC transport system ATP-binding protein
MAWEDSMPRRVALQPDRAVVVVTHDSRIFGFRDRIVQMSDGRIDPVAGRISNPPPPGGVKFKAI